MQEVVQEDWRFLSLAADAFSHPNTSEFLSKIHSVSEAILEIELSSHSWHAQFGNIGPASNYQSNR